MPASRRFPRDSWPGLASDEPPSAQRPFVLRGAEPEVGVVEAQKHRTPRTQQPHVQQTSRDGKTVPDTYYTPDD